MMKNILSLLLIGSLQLGFSSTALAETNTYTIDSQHTYVLWHIKHLGFSTQAGKWYVNGTLVLDKDKPQNSRVNVTIPVANISTGIEELDQHLKGKLFFDVEQFPTATFVSDSVVVSGKSAKVKGMLTLHGVTKPVTLNVMLNQEGVNPLSNKMTAGFSATATIKRSDFAITTLLPSLGDEVKLDIEVEAYKENK
jgi:polyisoprenoid-binding protein YceI